ncbi:protein DpdD [Kitasatospora sp. NPDC085879]|uniref:protein DpdD n=1 Tax=Kitasatospora sp. NPDC085879 TaxID=3154769 RepID=UPI00341D1625
MTQPENSRRDAAERFLRQFFGQGNTAWPGMDPQYPHKGRILPFVESFRRADDAPVVLPRMYSNADRFVVYVVARDSSDRARTAELIRAFAGPTYIAYAKDEGVVPARLDRSDPVESALLDFFGERPTFRLSTGLNPRHRRNLVDALHLMQQTAASRPPRLWRVAKPVGRLLAEFDASLSAGAAETSGMLLDHLAATGGMTASNLANLKIKRLDRLGRSEEILNSPELADVVRQDPPDAVKEAILNAVHTALEEPLADGDLALARQRLNERGRFVPDLFDIDIASVGVPALTVLLLAAHVLEDGPVLRRLVDAVQASGRSDQVVPAVWDMAVQQLQETGGTVETPPENLLPAEVAPNPADTDTAAVDSWPELVTELAKGNKTARTVLADRTWVSWPSPAADDAHLAELLDNLENTVAAEAWRAVGAFIDAVGYDTPAGLSARAFVRNAITFDRFGPSDLAVLQALMEIVLRAAPSAGDYAELLEEIGSEHSRWVSPERAPIVLDFVDRLSLAACPDLQARSSLAYRLLEPLSRHQARLDDTDLAFARRLSDELGVNFVWNARTADDGAQETPLAALPAMNVLLYSLDEAVLARSAEEIERLAPSVKAVTTHDHVGSPQLRLKARAADVIVLATRCAKHAATGFITQHSQTQHLHYADGSGSASMLRAAVAGLRAAAASR